MGDSGKLLEAILLSDERNVSKNPLIAIDAIDFWLKVGFL